MSKGGSAHSQAGVGHQSPEVDYKFSFNLFVFKYFPNDMTDTKEDNSAVYFRYLKI